MRHAGAGPRNDPGHFFFYLPRLRGRSPSEAWRVGAIARVARVTRGPTPTLPRKRGREKKVKIEILVRSTYWRKQPRAGATIKKAIAAAGKAASTPRAELAIVLSDDSAIRALNRDWRGKNAPTNVLSFPAAVPGKGRATRYIGDIVIAYQTTAREAVADGKPFRHHLAHLAVHGYLHLLGYDHETDRAAQRMERLERAILARIAVPDPYAARDPKTRQPKT
jgi:probable rRNA maturation factor